MDTPTLHRLILHASAPASSDANSAANSAVARLCDSVKQTHDISRLVNEFHNGHTALHVACLNGTVEPLRLLLSINDTTLTLPTQRVRLKHNGTDFGKLCATPLLLAALANRLDAAVSLLDCARKRRLASPNAETDVASLIFDCIGRTASSRVAQSHFIRFVETHHTRLLPDISDLSGTTVHTVASSLHVSSPLFLLLEALCTHGTSVALAERLLFACNDEFCRSIRSMSSLSLSNNDQLCA
jgi:hypothetical protein